MVPSKKNGALQKYLFVKITKKNEKYIPKSKKKNIPFQKNPGNILI